MWQIYHFRLGNIKKMDESFDAVLEFELEQMHRYEFSTISRYYLSKYVRFSFFNHTSKTPPHESFSGGRFIHLLRGYNI